MKFIALVSAFISFSLWANPRVGDRSVLEGRAEGMKVRIEASITRYDARQDKLLIVTKSSFGGAIQDLEEWVEADSVMTPEQGAMIVSECASLGGKQVVVPLRRGRFPACQITTPVGDFIGMGEILEQEANSLVWMGAFPINGMAKMTGPGMSLELIEFRWGK